MQNRRILNLFLVAQSIDYLVAGVFLAISHNLQQILVLRYFGHLLIAISFLTILSTVRFRWSHRLASFDIFSAALNIVTFAALLFAVLDEFLLKSNRSSSGFSLGESSTVGILMIIYLWSAIFAIIGVIMPIIRHRAHFHFSSRGWNPFLNWIFGLLALVFLIAGFLSLFTKAFPAVYFWGPSLSLLIYRIAFAN